MFSLDSVMESSFVDFFSCRQVVLMLVSGGVDSAVCAALLHKALRQGDDTSRVQAVHIDNGFLRKDESDQVVNSLQALGLNLRVSRTDFQVPFSGHFVRNIALDSLLK